MIGIVSAVLRAAMHEDEVVCTGAMGALMDFKVVEMLPLVRRTFERGKIDEMMYGAWDSVLIAFNDAPNADNSFVAKLQRRFAKRRVSSPASSV